MSARRRRVLVDIAGNSGDARRAVREIRDEIRRLGREQVEARIDVNERVVLAKLKKVQERIDRLKGQEASVKVDMQLAGAYAQLDRLNLRLDRLKAKRVNIDVDVSRGALERTAAGLGKLDRDVQKVGKGFASIFDKVPIIGGLFEQAFSGAFTLASSLGKAVGSAVTSGISALTDSLGRLGSLASPIGQVAGSVLSLGGSLLTLGIAAAGLIVVLNAVLGAIIALGGALVALVASAAAAAAGLGALAVAFGAALIPVAIVGLAIFTRFQAILKAHQAQQQAVAQATQNAKVAEQQHTAALQARQQAEQQLAQATVAARQAMAQAARDEANAELGLRNARNSVADSRLQLALAKRDLRDFLAQAGATRTQLSSLVKKFSDVDFNPAGGAKLFGQATGKKVDPLDLRQKIQAVRDAQLGVVNATNEVTNSEDRLAAARKKEADFTQRGLKAYAPYRQALQQVAKANDRVSSAEAAAERAHSKVSAALKKLSGTEQGTLSRLNGLIDGFKNFAKALADPIFSAVNSVFDQLKGHSGAFETALGKVGAAIADVVRALGSFLTEPATLHAFQTMATGAADLVRQLGARAFTSFLRIMREVATAALPAVREAAKGVADWLERIAGKPRKIHSAVHTLVAQFQTWAKFAGAVAGLVLALFRNAAPAGKSLADSMTRIVRHWTDWLNANPGAVRRFFRDAVQKVKDIVHWIKQAVDWLTNHLPKAAATAKAAFQQITPVLSGLLDLLKSMNRTTGSIVGKLLMPLAPRGSSGGIGKQKPIPPGWDYDLSTKQWFHNGKLSRTPPPGFLKGGLVGGSGRGDVIPAMLEPGEFVLRRSIVQQLSLPVLHALNGGSVPAPQPVAAGTTVGDFHAHITVPGGGAPDERVLIEKLDRAYRRRFG